MKDESKQWPHERIAALEAALRAKDMDVADAVALVLCHEAKIDRLAAEVKERDSRIERFVAGLPRLAEAIVDALPISSCRDEEYKQLVLRVQGVLAKAVIGNG